jgi:hypothetical protein
MASTHAWDNLTHDMREELDDLAHFSTIDAYRQGRVALWATLTALPLVWGLDMLFGVMTDRWDSYVAVWANNFLPGSADDAVLWIGAVTVAIGVLVAVAPHFGGDVLGIWLVVLAINLFGVDGIAHLAVGMLALAFCSFAMARMVRGDHIREA